MDTLSYANYPSISSIDLALQSYLTSTQIEDSYYNKNETDTTLYTSTAQILNNFHSQFYIDNMFLTSAQTGTSFYTKTGTGNLLANKVSTTGGGSMAGHLDVGISCDLSRIRSHAKFNGYNGYAELNAARSYDMYLNLEATRVNGGWVFFKINGDSYMQLVEI